MSSAQEEFNELMRDKERRTAHPEDDDGLDGQSFLNLSESEDEATPPAMGEDPLDMFPAPASHARTTIPLTRYEANTGPKGVISDAQNFRDSRRLHRVSMRAGLTQVSQPQGRLEQEAFAEEKMSDSDTDDEDGDDLEFMQRWRMNRLKQLQSGTHDSKVYNKQRKSRMWGGLTTVDGNGYLNAVDNSPSDAVVVVYIYDDEVICNVDSILRLKLTHE